MQLEYRARHRVIAELVQDRLQALGELKDVVVGLAFAASSKVNPAMRRNERPWQLLNHLMDHEFLGRVLGVMDAREVYGAIEGLVVKGGVNLDHFGGAKVDQLVKG